MTVLDQPRTGSSTRWHPDERIVLPVLAIAAGAHGIVGRSLGDPRLQQWSTIFVAITVQALPFLVLGTLVSGAVSTLVSPRLLARVLGRRPIVSVPLAALCGAALPGCECASVPVAGRLTQRGVPGSAALAFMLAAPAVNPVVLVATAVAFPGRPAMVGARFTGSLIAAIVMGLIWSRLDPRGALLRVSSQTPDAGGGVRALAGVARVDFLHAAGWLVVGAAAAASLQVFVPKVWLDDIATHKLLALPVLGLFAVALSICSEADAFVAASLRQFSLSARLVFLVVGPAIDLKLAAMQWGTFGRRFAVRFGPLTFVVAVLSGSLAAWCWL
ncbi:MAG: uncharacterized protein QOF82_1734 [Frankiales bacterium]|nr:uncharacterized protein [Frankiales bacterium]MDX6209370.1 uncharacterized protein [Frankiales bacterium]MDX6212647.1 uncharacterized protein [Frankiales bacterium]